MDNTCPICGHDLDTASFGERLTFCPYCGNRIPPRVENIDYGFCPFCGGKRTDDGSICHHCGKQLSTQKQPAAPLTEPSFPPLTDVSEPDIISNGYAGGVYNGNGDTLLQMHSNQSSQDELISPLSPVSNDEIISPLQTTSNEVISPLSSTSHTNEIISPLSPTNTSERISPLSPTSSAAPISPIASTPRRRVEPISPASPNNGIDVFSAVNQASHSQNAAGYPSSYNNRTTYSNYNSSPSYSTSSFSSAYSYNDDDDHIIGERYDNSYSPSFKKEKKSKEVRNLERYWAKESGNSSWDAPRGVSKYDDYRSYKRGGSGGGQGLDSVSMYIIIFIVILLFVGGGFLLWWYFTKGF